LTNQDGHKQMPKAVLLLSIGVLVLSSFVLAYGRGPEFDETASKETSKLAAKVVIQYYRQVASAAGVQSSLSVRKALDAMDKALEAENVSDVMVELIRQSQEVEAAIGSQMRRQYREIVIQIIQNDPRIRQSNATGTILVSGQDVVEGQELLSPVTIRRLKEANSLKGMTEIIGLRVHDQQLRILSPTGDVEYYNSMEKELTRLQERLGQVERATGLLAIEGQGVIIEAADAPGGYLWEEIVHEQDIREIVNTLHFAGAQGVEIGGQRLGTGGWVRCVGPVVVVNGQTVAANPIIIKAIGPARELRDSVTELQEIFALTGKRLDTKESSYLMLKALPGARAEATGT